MSAHRNIELCHLELLRFSDWRMNMGDTDIKYIRVKIQPGALYLCHVRQTLIGRETII